MKTDSWRSSRPVPIPGVAPGSPGSRDPRAAAGRPAACRGISNSSAVNVVWHANSRSTAPACCWLVIKRRSSSSRRTVPTKRWQIAFPRSASGGVLTIWMLMAANTASKAAVNLLSRSRIRNRKRRWASSRSMSRLRACWVSQAPVGVRSDAQDVYPAGCVLDDEERVQPKQGDRVEMEQASAHTADVVLVDPGFVAAFPWRSRVRCATCGCRERCHGV
jgi:hypothetical protein